MTETMPKTTLDARAFRSALGAFVTGVTIITTVDAQGTPVGLTANSFNSVSLDPPLVLFSLGLDSTSLDAFRQAEWWAVHVLSANQEQLSNQFAKRDGDKFKGVAFTQGAGGVPLLDGFAARFICRAAFEYEGGDHAIFLGEVQAFEQAGEPPLIYHRGRYGGVFPAGTTDAKEAASLDDLQRHGLVAAGGLLTPEGRQVADGLAVLADLDSRFSKHERAALRHLLSRLS
jgi:3-hydroxy-9,10-secoandrosta-1,3,5(10)-triene-9,17-dione monooxygenase reductase component